MISIMIPSRGRPTELKECLDTIFETAKKPEDIQVVVYLDNDDVSPYGDAWLFPNVRIIEGQRKKLSAYFDMQGCTGDIFLMGNDDIRFRTHGWDAKVIEAFDKIPDKIAVVYGDDGNPNPTTNVPFPFVHKNWVLVTGHLTPPIFSNNFSDSWVSDIATMLDRKVKLDMVIEHLHPDFGKREQDQTDKEKWAKHWSEDMPKKYVDTLPEREAEAAKLKKFIEEFK